MVKVNASPEGIKTIQSRQKNKARQNNSGWAKNSDGCWAALMAASKYQFTKAVRKKFDLPSDDDYAAINIPTFRQWITSHEVFIHEQKNSTRLDSQSVVDKLLQDSINNNVETITIGEIVGLIEDRETDVRTDRVTYRNWKYFLEGKCLDKDIFIAFCYALGLENEWKTLVQIEDPPIYSSEKTQVDYLSQYLNEFNHRDQIEKIKEKIIFTKNNQVTAFLFVNKCPYSQTWMLRRIEHEMKNKWYRDRPVEVHNLNLKKNICVGIPVLESRFQEYISTDFSQKQLILILNIDKYLLYVEQIISDLWRPLLDKAHQQRPNSVLLFLMCQKLENYLQEKWRENQILRDYMAQLPCPSYTKKELGEVISNIADNFGFQFQQYLEESQEVIAEKLMNEYEKMMNEYEQNCQQNASIEDPTHTRNLLKGIYKHFHCPDSDNEVNRQWQNYPPT